VCSDINTLVLSADDPQALQQAAELLKQGGLVAFPTDTVYGVAAHALKPASVERIYAVKGRMPQKALPVMIARVEDLPSVATDISADTWALAKRFWPGGLTLVMHRTALIPDAVTSNGPTVAIRIPNHPVPLKLIELVGAPLAVTSANQSGHPSPTTAEEVKIELFGKIEVLLDGGRCPGGIESTVINASTGEPVILRQGAISAEELEQTLGKSIKRSGQ
jgi:L-threonylcarbamoyladenylate synthase